MIELLQTEVKEERVVCGVDCERRFDLYSLLACRLCFLDRNGSGALMMPSKDCPIFGMEIGTYQFETIIKKMS